MQPVPNQPTQYNPNIGYTPSAPVQPAPQYNPNIAPPQPLPTVNQQYHQPLAHKQGLLQNSEKGTFANMKILSVAICILLMGSGFGIGWFTNDVFDSPGSIDDAFTGKWFTRDGDDSLWFKADGTTWTWDSVEFQCADGTDTVPMSWVNDGWDDCDDGSDEGISTPVIFYDWRQNDGWSSSESKVEAEWYVSKSDKLCQNMKAKSNLTESSITLCSHYQITDKVLWLVDGEAKGLVECKPYLSMERNSGPQTAGGDDDDNGEWISQWNYAFSDFLTLKPSWCDEIDFR